MLQADLIFLGALTLFSWQAAADTMEKGPFSCKPVIQVHFTKNQTSAHFNGSIERWQQACYSFAAREGQHLKVDLDDFNQSAAFTIYRPGYVISYGNYTDEGKYVSGWGTRRFPSNTYGGRTLTPPPEMQATALRTYSTILPESGTYLVVVDLSEAGASTFGGRIAVR